MYIDFNKICVANSIIATFGTLMCFYDLSEIREATEQEKFDYYLVNGE